MFESVCVYRVDNTRTRGRTTRMCFQSPIFIIIIIIFSSDIHHQCCGELTTAQIDVKHTTHTAKTINLLMSNVTVCVVWFVFPHEEERLTHRLHTVQITVCNLCVQIILSIMQHLQQMFYYSVSAACLSSSV